ncbi:MAG TPA: RNA 2',3'-cyclic phosphodiesterase [Pyrinomonadaceae bacterium]|nr:RNA 2',3'-cyclic phosphodiesterase [Pyrinomonadaceae bacterium]
MPTSFALRAHCRQDVCAPSQAWRVFCAIELPRAVREEFTRHINRLKKTVPGARASWGRVENLHLTLKFLGDIPVASIQGLSAAAGRSVAGLSPFRISLEQTGVFPPHGAPRVLWIGVKDMEGKLAALHARLEIESEKAGFPKETRTFHPHLTLARLRKPQHARRLATAHLALAFEPAEIEVAELLVIRSELRNEGSRYTTISRHQLLAQ